jgi:hypothetical protein
VGSQLGCHKIDNSLPQLERASPLHNLNVAGGTILGWRFFLRSGVAPVPISGLHSARTVISAWEAEELSVGPTAGEVPPVVAPRAGGVQRKNGAVSWTGSW